MDITTIQTKTGKTIADFSVPDGLIGEDVSLVELILKSESMNDDERQYWLNLWEVMTPSQREKLRGILTRERDKLAEIEAKYGEPKEKTPEEIKAKKAQVAQMAQMRKEKQAELKAREQEEQEAEKLDEDALLGELDNL